MRSSVTFVVVVVVVFGGGGVDSPYSYSFEFFVTCSYI